MKVLPISVEQSSGSKIRLRVPPITRARRATACTQYTLIHPIKLSTILLTLKNLLPRFRRWILPLQPRFNTLILIIKIRHINHEILHHKHMRQRRYRRIRTFGRNLRQTRESITTVDVHRTRTTDPFTARSTESETWIDFVLDLNKGVQNHRPALL